MEGIQTKKVAKLTRTERATIRNAVDNYMYSEGCSCCQDTDQHKVDKAAIAKLLHVKKFEDGSDYDFGKFRTLKQ